MKDWKKICRKLLFPPLWLMIILTVVSTAMLVAVFVNSWETHPVAYAVYVMSFYTLTVICIGCWQTFPGYYKSIKERVYANKYANRYMTDVAFKTHVNLYRSLFVNTLYVAVNAFSGMIYRSAWFGVLAFYYIILSVMRFLLLRYVNRNGIGKKLLGEWKRYRLCGIILIAINLALSGAVLMILYQDKGFEYNGILIYIMAMYTFYITTTAIIEMVKYYKYNSPVMSCSKVIKLAAALVSMLSLETAMLAQFGAENSAQFRRVMVAATGAGVSVVVIAMSGYMIVRSTKQINKLRENDRILSINDINNERTIGNE